MSPFKDFEDYMGDKRYNIRTIPVVFGLRKSFLILTILTILTLASIGFFALTGYLEKFLIYPTVISIGLVCLIMLLFALKKVRLSSRNSVYSSLFLKFTMVIAVSIEVIYALFYVGGG